MWKNQGEAMSDIRHLLAGAIDLHVHCPPDVIPRAQNAIELVIDARDAGMAGLLIKDHTGTTVKGASILNSLHPSGPHLYSAICLNPPVGGLNPYAVEAALAEGAVVVFFPTYGAKHQIDVLGPDAFASAFPRPRSDWPGITVLGTDGTLKPVVLEILDLIADHDAVLATGHISSAESLILLEQAKERGIKRMLVNHASEAVPGMSDQEQRQAVSLGAYIEHCLLAVAPSFSHRISMSEISRQIRIVGVDNVIISSDFGQIANGPVVPAFSRYLGDLQTEGFSDEEIRKMIVNNPRKLLSERVGTRGSG